MLQVSELCFGYATTEFRFDFELPAGRILAVTGPSGAGKTTLLNLLAGFETPQSGQILWSGESWLGYSPNQRGISMLFQSHNLFDHLSAAANADLGLSPNRAPTAEQVAQRDQAFEDLGIGGLQNRLPGALSGGQQQRVALARCLISPRPLILLDEPFSALDQNSRADALSALKVLQSQGKTLILVTHHLADIEALGADHYPVESPAVRAAL